MIFIPTLSLNLYKNYTAPKHTPFPWHEHAHTEHAEDNDDDPIADVRVHIHILHIIIL